MFLKNIDMNEESLNFYNKYPIGFKFEDSEVISLPFYKIFQWKRKTKKAYIKCKCFCGKIFDLPYNTLSKTKSCGCRTYEIVSKTLTKGSLVINGIKKCCHCLKEQSEDNFYPKKTKLDKKDGRCKTCHRLLCTLKKYNVSHEIYEKMLEKQNNRCGICKNLLEETTTKRVFFDIDHNHTTGKVRGLLCICCNRGLGYFKDSINNLNEAINYLNNS